MRILITGGAGFIARNLLEGLNREYSLVSCNSKELNLLDSEEVLDYIKKGRFDQIIHTATYDAAPKHSKKDPSKVLENNLRMFFNVVRCRKYFKKMIYFGSGAEFDREHWIPKMKEDYFDQHISGDQYGLSKYIMNKYTQSSSNIYNLRLFAVFGRYEDWRVRLISNICHNLSVGKPITIDRNKFYDFLYIDDLVKIVKWFIDHKPKRNVYNVCTGNTQDFKTIARKLIKISGRHQDLVIKTEGLGREYSGDNSLLLDELKGFKFKSIERSLEELYQWYDLHKK